MRFVPLAAIAVALLVPGCVSPGDAAGISGIQGHVVIGPTCPAEHDPPDPDCDERGYATRLAVMKAGRTGVLKEFDTKENGTFREPLPPGEYSIRHADHGKPYPTCTTNTTIAVKPGNYTWITVHCDSGIR